ncbi:MAG: epimerase [Gaiellaceae bacterium]
MKVLILGGTVFLGRHLVTSGVERGHEITIFNRGRHTPAGSFPEVEQLRGDRDEDIGALDGRRWDAVIDTSGNQPDAVRAAAERLVDSVDNYAFVSTLAVYQGFPFVRGLEESAPLRIFEGGGAPPRTPETAALHKAMCERTLDAVMPEQHLIVRAGFLAGPHDPTDRFTCWPRRIAAGGEVLAPGDPNVPVQLIDARDLAAWIFVAVEAGLHGAYNATGPASTLTMQAFLEACRDATGSDATFTWVDERFLLSAGVKPRMELPVWMPGAPDAGTADCRKALRDGLEFRSLVETARDTLDWDRSRPESEPRRAGLVPEREAEVLAAWANGRRVPSAVADAH